MITTTKTVPVLLKELTFIFGLSLLIALANWRWGGHSAGPPIRSLTWSEVRSLKNKTLIDLRSEQQFRAGHLTDAQNLSANALSQATKKLVLRGSLIVYADNPELSKEGAEQLRRLLGKPVHALIDPPLP